MSPLASLFVLGAVITLAACWLTWSIRRSPIHTPEPSTLDLLDTLDNPCNEHRPHRMLPTNYGWKCANNCGESWYIDPADALATADLALWELELGADA